MLSGYWGPLRGFDRVDLLNHFLRVVMNFCQVNEKGGC